MTRLLVWWQTLLATWDDMFDVWGDDDDELREAIDRLEARDQ